MTQQQTSSDSYNTNHSKRNRRGHKTKGTVLSSPSLAACRQGSVGASESLERTCTGTQLPDREGPTVQLKQFYNVGNIQCWISGSWNIGRILMHQECVNCIVVFMFWHLISVLQKIRWIEMGGGVKGHADVVEVDYGSGPSVSVLHASLLRQLASVQPSLWNLHH